MERLWELAVAGPVAVMVTCAVHCEGLPEVVPHPAPSPDSPDSPTCGRLHDCHVVRCQSYGVEEGAAAAGEWVTAAWEPWQSFV